MSVTQGLENGIWSRRLRRRSPRGTVLWIHGLGESGLCFENLLSLPALADWDHYVEEAERRDRPRGPLRR